MPRKLFIWIPHKKHCESMFNKSFFFISPYISNRAEKVEALEVEVSKIMYDEEIIDYLDGEQKELAERIINLENDTRLGRFFLNAKQLNNLLCSLKNIYLSKPHELLKKYAKNKSLTFQHVAERINDLYNWTTMHLQCSKDIVLDYMNSGHLYLIKKSFNNQ